MGVLLGICLDKFYEFEQDRGSVRKAFNAAIPAFQLVDHFYKYFEETAPSVISAWRDRDAFLIHLGATEPAFITVQSVATAYKHLYIYALHYDGGSPGALRSVVSSDTSFGDMGGDNTAPIEVVWKRKDGTSVVFYECLRRVVEDMWPKLLPKDRDG
jgi:hypothetical protein